MAFEWPLKTIYHKEMKNNAPRTASQETKLVDRSMVFLRMVDGRPFRAATTTEKQNAQPHPNIPTQHHAIRGAGIETGEGGWRHRRGMGEAVRETLRWGKGNATADKGQGKHPESGGGLRRRRPSSAHHVFAKTYDIQKRLS